MKRTLCNIGLATLVSIALCAAVPAQAGVLFFDDFNSGTISNTWNPDVAAYWTANSDAYQIEAVGGGATHYSTCSTFALPTSDWVAQEDVRWISPLNENDPQYGIAGMIITDTPSNPFSGNYLMVTMSHSYYVMWAAVLRG